MTGRISKNELNESLKGKIDSIGDIETLNPDIGAVDIVDALNKLSIPSSEDVYDDVDNLTGISIEEGIKAKLTWNNPSSNEFQGVDVFVHTSDISNINYNTALIDLTRVEVGKSEISYIHSVEKGTVHYFKVFSKYIIDGEVRVSDGKSTIVITEDRIPPNPVTDFKVVDESANSVSLSWTNPTDADFSKVKIVYRTGSYPTGSNSGAVAYEGNATNTIVAGLLLENETYYFRIFTYDIFGNENKTTVGQQVSGFTASVRIYGVKIDTLNSNPSTALTYIDNAVGMTPAPFGGGASGWDDVFPFNQIRPVMFKDGTVREALSVNDFSKTVSGVPIDNSTTTANGEVMIEFPTIYWKIETVGTNLYVRYTNRQLDSSWKALGHTRGDVVKPYVYLGAYLGIIAGGTIGLYSLRGRTPTTDKTLANFRSSLVAREKGYDLIGYYQILMLQILFIVKHKSLNSQSSLGKGYVSISEGGSVQNTGGTSTKGMNFGEVTGTEQMKFCGIEDLWGNASYFLEGIKTNTLGNILLSTQNFSSSDANYVVHTQFTGDEQGTPSKVSGDTDTGFIMTESQASTSMYYSDYSVRLMDNNAYFGGHYSGGEGAGIFSLLILSNKTTGNSVSVGARTMFLAN